MKCTLARIVIGLSALVALVAAPMSSLAAQPGAGEAQLQQYVGPDGNRYFALTIPPGAVAKDSSPRDVVVLFDTSASQTGQFREAALGALSAALDQLNPKDRVQLLAVDLDAVPMSEGFVAPAGEEMAAAMEKLDRRAPLGATDLAAGLDAALDAFPSGSENPRALIYLGEGSSRANLLSADELGEVVARLREARVPVTSLPIGPRTDEQLLGALAAQTGGSIIRPTDEPAPATLGGQLASAADATVMWPESAKWSDNVETVLPTRQPPLRSDRDTVVVGKLSSEKPVDVSLTLDGVAGRETLDYSLEPADSNEDYNFLAELVRQGEATDGMALPLVGSESLDFARAAVEAGSMTLTELARQALASGNLDDAERLAAKALEQEPGNARAEAVQRAVERRRAGEEPAAGGGAGADLAGEPGGDGAIDLDLVGGDAPPFAIPGGGDVAADVAAEQNLMEQLLRTQVQSAVNQARGQLGVDPIAAKQNLKQTLETVRQTPDLRPEIRDQLVGALQAAIREATRQQEDLERRRQERMEREAFNMEQQLILDNLQRKQEKLDGLMERFNALMDEGRYRLAEEEVGPEVAQLAPESTLAPQASLFSRQTYYHRRNQEVRVASQKGFMDLIQSVETSAIPTPDDPPIIFPDPEVWKELSAARKEKYSSMDLANRSKAEKRINEALKSPTTLEFIDTPLSAVVEYLKDRHEIEIQLDRRALEDMGIPTETPVTSNLKGISLRSALRLMLNDLGLKYLIKDEVLLITTPEELENPENMPVKVYPVADLVIPIRQPSFAGGFGGLGGMGGFGSGMGMGGGGGMGGQFGQGGGMGGGMGGMGGGMGGMGGGGFFNVPVPGGQNAVPGGNNVIPNAPVNNPLFSVEDDLSEIARNDAPASVPNLQPAGRATDERAQPEEIRLSDLDGTEPRQHWDAYFQANRPEEAAVRDAARRLMRRQEFDHVIAMLQSCLRHGQAQPWMYEALGLAMQADGRDQAEIERAVMSAVDFLNSPDELMYIGEYLSRLGLERRALSIFQQAADLAPWRPEAYLAGLRAAQRLDDLKGIEWATVGILGQAWPEDQTEVFRVGMRVAKATLERLKSEGRTNEAEQYQVALDEAISRDCVVIVSWSGKADVDVMVEEPTGTVCSLRQPRTAGGGVMLGDGHSSLGERNSGISREVYVCPKGFDGTYRVLVRRVWGEVTAGKVTVDVYTHYRSPNASRVRKKIDLSKDEALVKFALEDGQRRRPMNEQLVAQAAAGQMAVRQAVGQHVLAQQLAAAADQRALADLSLSSGGNNGGGNVFNPFAALGGNAVGYQPVIITLPEGANMAASAVISADRRYVRITTVPLFSGIAEVNVFNMATGENSEGRGGTGGQGFGGLFSGQTQNNNEGF